MDFDIKIDQELRKPKGTHRPLKKSVPITTTIPFNMWEEIHCKARWNDLIIEGWQNRIGFDGVKKQQRETNEEIKVLQYRNQNLGKIVFELQEKISKLEGVKK